MKYWSILALILLPLFAASSRNYPEQHYYFLGNREDAWEAIKITLNRGWGQRPDTLWETIKKADAPKCVTLFNKACSDGIFNG